MIRGGEELKSEKVALTKGSEADEQEKKLRNLFLFPKLDKSARFGVYQSPRTPKTIDDVSQKSMRVLPCVTKAAYHFHLCGIMRAIISNMKESRKGAREEVLELKKASRTTTR